MRCPQCDREFDTKLEDCPNCGHPVESSEDPPSSDEESQPTMSERLKEMAGKIDVEGPEKDASVLDVPWTEGSYSGKAMRMRMITTALVTLAFIALGIYFSVNDMLPERYSTPMWAVMLGIPVLLWIHFGIIYFYRTWTIRYKLTTHRFFHEKGLIRRTTDVIEVIDISDMKMEQTLWDRYINGGVATIVLESSDDSHPNLVIDGLEEPRKVFDSIDEIRRVQRQQRGLKSI